MRVPAPLAPLVSGTTYRRAVHLILGAVILLPYVLLGSTFVDMFADPHASRGGILVALAAALVIGAVPPFLGGTRSLEIAAARHLLDAEVPESDGRDGLDLETRLRASLWVGLHLAAGGLVGLLLLIAVPLALIFVAQRFGIASDALAGLSIGPFDEHDTWWLTAAGLVLLIATGYAMAALGALAAVMAPVLLGPSQAERVAALEARSRRLAERNRLARDLHDSVGHALTVTTLQAAAAREVFDTDPAFARRALAAELGAAVSAAVLLSTAVAAFAMTGAAAVRPRGAARALLLAFGWTVCAVLLVVVPDSRLLTLAGYAPILIVGAPFGWPPVEYSLFFTWPLVHQLWCVAGGVLLAWTVLAWQRRTAGVCVSCGRRADGTGRSSAAAVRWGRRATWTAAVIPALYAVTRLAWAAGIPLGVAPSFLDSLRQTGAVWAGAGLGAFAVAGSILTLGLAQRWGEVFPRWIPGLAGRPVPVNLAFGPAMLVAVLATSAGIGFLSTPALLEMTGGWNLASLPVALWPVWGVALGVAAIAYRMRRRGPCRDCGGPTAQLADQMAALRAVANVTHAQ